MVIKKHIDDVQPRTVEEHLQAIQEDRDVIDSEFAKVTTADLPEWFDERLFKIGQTYYMNNLLALGTANLAGLIAILSVPSLLEILVYTKNNSTLCLSYRRFIQTLLLTYSLFNSDMLDPNSKWFKAINVIRWKHATVSKKRIREGLHGIYQKDMAITQFGFVGYVVTCPELIGLAHTTTEELEGFNHFWRVKGHLLGIKDRLNICRKTVEETTELCRKISSEILAKHLENPPPEFGELASNAVKALWFADPSINVDAFLYLTYNITGAKYKRPLGWYSYLNMKGREWILYMCSK
ncbi:uncharacterized protein LOC108631410 isoform X3 [Ceratina calcarata]|uniref:Uncharacterized protein LOC108631410 isoform X3 n=1 Tax=Ceratina calcarata TaxID=156304 RepID=A0AAJ7SB07_9HYME|nr:uncharacterized protein LOC108631410 isoform X3 [Ceratina calcarata]